VGHPGRSHCRSFAPLASFVVAGRNRHRQIAGKPVGDSRGCLDGCRQEERLGALAGRIFTFSCCKPYLLDKSDGRSCGTQVGSRGATTRQFPTCPPLKGGHRRRWAGRAGQLGRADGRALAGQSRPVSRTGMRAACTAVHLGTKQTGRRTFTFVRPRLHRGVRARGFFPAFSPHPSWGTGKGGGQSD